MRHGPLRAARGAHCRKGASLKKLIGRIAWDKSRAEAAKLEAQGFADLLGDPPALGAAEQQAVHCWRFCANTWAPALWPLYHALHQVDDWPLLIDLMDDIRTHV